MATVASPVEQRFHLSDVSWGDYLKISESLGERPIRATFDRGELELMTLSSEHERYKKLLARLVETLTEEMAIDIASCGSMTCRREEMLRGMEPDECYWIASEPSVRGRLEIDLDRDPPPDLAFEIEISRSLLNRLAILAALRVPEVWRWDGENLRVLLLTPTGDYEESETSRAFPFLPINDFAQFLQPTNASETQWIRSFRTWVRQKIEAGWQGGDRGNCE